jgi:hypothetical protein
MERWGLLHLQVCAVGSCLQWGGVLSVPTRSPVHPLHLLYGCPRGSLRRYGSAVFAIAESMQWEEAHIVALPSGGFFSVCRTNAGYLGAASTADPTAATGWTTPGGIAQCVLVLCTWTGHWPAT